MRKSFGVAVLMGLLGLGGVSHGAAIGNAITDRGAGDGQTTVLEVYASTPIPSAGTIDSFSYYGASGGAFDAYIFRPTGTANQFTVLYDSGSVASVAGAQTVSITPVAVQAGDVIAHYGNGISFETGGEDPQFIYYPQTPPPSSGTFTATADHTSYDRTYSFAADFVPEPASLSLLCLGTLPLLARRSRA